MILVLIALFILLPILELWLIVQIAHATSWAATILIVLGTGILGTMMTRRQGLKIWRRIQQALHRGEIPGNDLLDGLLLLVGGILLITPGLVTDTIGLFLLVPFTRVLVRSYLKKRFQHSLAQKTSRFSFYSSVYPPPPNGDNDIIDAEWEEEPPPSRQIPRE